MDRTRFCWLAGDAPSEPPPPEPPPPPEGSFSGSGGVGVRAVNGGSAVNGGARLREAADTRQGGTSGALSLMGRTVEGRVSSCLGAAAAVRGGRTALAAAAAVG